MLLTDKDCDLEFEDVSVAAVEDGGTGWSIQRSDGWSFWVERSWGVEPKVGDVARFYGRGIGYPVRGLDIAGRQCFYRTEAEEREKRRLECEERARERRYDFERDRHKLDADYSALPRIFQQRIDKFRRNNPDFRWQFESYELFCCKQAVVIAAALDQFRADSPTDRNSEAYRATVHAAFVAFRELPWAEQKRRVPGLDDDHSGNTFGAACKLAYWFLTNPEAVEKSYGSLAPLVGSEEYGCVPRDAAP